MGRNGGFVSDIEALAQVRQSPRETQTSLSLFLESSSFPSLYDLARIVDAVAEGFNTPEEVTEVNALMPNFTRLNHLKSYFLNS